MVNGWVSSSTTIDCDRKSIANFGHSTVAQPTNPIGKYAYGYAFNGVKVDGGSATYRIFAWFKGDFAG